ncbi:MAG: ribosome maturation factor RimP [Alphaproteobacteria bacterium]
MELSARVAALIEPALAQLGYELVRVALTGRTPRVLQVMIEPADGRVMTVEDCSSVSDVVSALLDVEDPVPGAYNLEVSSPGLDRPLTRVKDYERFAGFEVKVELERMIDGRRRFRGLLVGTRPAAAGEGLEVVIESEGEQHAVPLAEIAAAKLVLTDDLVKAAMHGVLPTALQAAPSGTTDTQTAAGGPAARKSKRGG